MRTDVIHLESFDDIDSIRDRLEWSRAERIILAWPKRRGIAFDQVDMVMLVRKAVALGRQIAIVNGGSDIDDLASAAGIPTFRSQASATLAAWPRLPVEDLEPSADHDVQALRLRVEDLRGQPGLPSRRRTPIFAAGVGAVFLLLTFFMPGAVIHIYPAEMDQRVSLEITAGPSTTTADLAGNLPLLSLTSLQSATDRVDTSGSAMVADLFARGVVSVENLTDKPIVLPEGSVVTTSGEPVIRFSTTTRIEIPPGGNAMEVEVQAVQPGSSGNLPAEEVKSLEGPYGPEISVINEEAMEGGGESLIKSPSEDDIATLREKIKSRLLSQAREEFLASHKDGQRLIDETLRIEKVLDEEISSRAGQPADILEISLTGETRIDYIRDEDILAACELVLNAGLPEGYVPLGGQVQFSTRGDPRYDRQTGSVRWQIDASRKLRSDFSSAAVIRAVTGRTPLEGLRRLAGMLDQRQAPEFKLSPSWWPVLPFLPFRISVEAG